MGVRRDAPEPTYRTYPPATGTPEPRAPICEAFYCRYEIWLNLICVLVILLLLICWFTINVRQQVQPAAWFRDLIILSRNPNHPILTETAVMSLLEDFEDKDSRGVAMRELTNVLLPNDIVQDAKKTIRTSQAGCPVPPGNV